MFEEYPDTRLKPEPTPERVMAMLRTLAHGPATRSKLSEMMSLSQDAHRTEFADVLATVRELGFIKEVDDTVSLGIDPSLFAEFALLRRTVSGIVFNRPKSSFFIMSQKIIALNEDIFTVNNWQELADRVSDDQFTFHKKNVYGWRWWAAFLGLGYLHTNTFIPNLAVRIKDALLTADSFPPDTRLQAEAFVSKLEGLCPESGASRRHRKLGLGVSNGIRLLAQQGLIVVENMPDGDRWYLHHLETHELNGFTHIMLRGDERGLV